MWMFLKQFGQQVCCGHNILPRYMYIIQVSYGYSAKSIKHEKPLVTNDEYINSKTKLNAEFTLNININKTNNHLSPRERLNSDGHQFHQYQQNKQSPLT
jgi:hypothetical protein